VGASESSVAEKYRSVSPVNAVFPDVPRGHDLQVTRVGVDEYAVRVEYKITPLLARPGGRPAIHWTWQGSDDSGNVYVESGGAFGPSDDGRATDGVLSLTPIPTPGVHTLHIVLEPWISREGDQRSVSFEVVVDVPGPVRGTSAAWPDEAPSTAELK
jgi:hypothetical protein